jgi:hypothetical protein
MVGLSGLEPPTSRLSGVRSNQLSYRPILERVMRIELTTRAWKALVLPLNYTRVEAAPGFEPGIRVLQTRALPLGYAANQPLYYLYNFQFYNIILPLKIQMAGLAGFEPAHDGVKVRCLTAWL